MVCKYCGKKVILTPSAEERAKKGNYSANYYRQLFPNHSACEVAARDNKPNPYNGLFFNYKIENHEAILISQDKPF